MKTKFKEAHKMAREIKAEYPEVDYSAQFGLCLSYILKNEEENEMTDLEKWYESLDQKEKSRLKDGAEARTGFLRNNETAEEWKARGKENYDKILKQKYDEYLRSLENEKRKEEDNRQEEIQEEKTHQNNLAKGIATIELYESNKYRCWAAEITGTDNNYGLARKFINPIETKGNYKTYQLKEGKCYNYLNDNKQHFAKVVNSELIEMSKEEMMDLVG